MGIAVKPPSSFAELLHKQGYMNGEEKASSARRAIGRYKRWQQQEQQQDQGAMEGTPGEDGRGMGKAAGGR